MRILYIPRKTTPLANSKYGILYNWYAATGGSFVAGWHLPTRSEWNTVSANLGGDTVSGGHLKEAGLVHWNTPNTGADNSSGFTAFGSGRRYLGAFDQLMGSAVYWANNDYGGVSQHVVLGQSTAICGFGSSAYATGNSIRLLCDSSTDPGFVDIDGKRYNTVKIDDQVWLAENLKATHYADGTPISEVTDNTAWAALTTPGLCAYNNDWNNV